MSDNGFQAGQKTQGSSGRSELSPGNGTGAARAASEGSIPFKSGDLPDRIGPLWWPATAHEMLMACQVRGCSRPTAWMFDAGGMGLLRICSLHGDSAAILAERTSVDARGTEK